MPTHSESNSRLEALRAAPPNSWVALTDDGETVIAIADSYAEVVRQSEAAGVEDPTVMKTPQEWMSLSL